MPIGLIIFLIYLAIVIFSRMQRQARKETRDAEKKHGLPDDNEIPFIPGFEKKEVTKTEKGGGKESIENTKIIIDDEIIKASQKNIINQTEETLMANHIKNEIFPEDKSILEDFHEDILVNGIILSELLGLPRAMRPGRQHKRYRIIS